jgi:spermidine/putrescine transport system permease protein
VSTSRRRRILAWFAVREAPRAWALLAAPALFLLALVFVPLALMGVYSVLERGTYGGVEWRFTLEAYARFLDPLYLRILARSIGVAMAATVLSLAVGLPLALAIARAGRWKHLLLFLVILPFWTSFLVRTSALLFLLREDGPINAILLDLGVIDAPLELLYTRGAVLLGLVYGHLPFAVLPMYAALEKLDPALLEAAEILGARPWARFRRIILPLAAPGVLAAGLLVFIPALGAFLTPDLMGGAKDLMIGNLVQNQFTSARNWPFGSAASFVLMALTLAGVVAWLRARAQGEAGAA